MTLCGFESLRCLKKYWRPYSHENSIVFAGVGRLVARCIYTITATFSLYRRELTLL